MLTWIGPSPLTAQLVTGTGFGLVALLFSRLDWSREGRASRIAARLVIVGLAVISVCHLVGAFNAGPVAGGA